MTLKLATISADWVASAAFSFAVAASFALGIALASKETGIIFFCWHVNQKLETLSTFTFALALELVLDESSDFPCWLMHVLAPTTLGALISPKQVFVYLCWGHSLYLWILIVELPVR